MRSWALVVAGGAGERMRRSGSETAKPLVVVGGRPLLQHNVETLLDHGFTDIAIAVSAEQPAVRSFAQETCAELIARARGAFRLIAEESPLGSIGSAAFVDADADDILVVNADNLTTLDLAALVRDHRGSGADATLAVHEEPFAMPFGEVTLDGDRVVAYTEKPTYRITIATAVTVLGRGAIDLITPGEFINLPHLAQRMLDGGRTIHAYAHDAPWIDVNDLTAARRAASMLAATTPEGD